MSAQGRNRHYMTALGVPPGCPQCMILQTLRIGGRETQHFVPLREARSPFSISGSGSEPRKTRSSLLRVEPSRGMSAESAQNSYRRAEPGSRRPAIRKASRGVCPFGTPRPDAQPWPTLAVATRLSGQEQPQAVAFQASRSRTSCCVRRQFTPTRSPSSSSVRRSSSSSAMSSCLTEMIMRPLVP